MLQLNTGFIISTWRGYARPYAIFNTAKTSIHNVIMGFLESHEMESCVHGFHVIHEPIALH